MPFIGKKPTAAPLTSSDVADGIISNAKLAQDIISGDTALGATPADTDELLVSDAGTLKRMDYSHIKGGGTHTLLNTTTVTSDTTNIDFNSSLITATYPMYEIVIEYLSSANSSSVDTDLQLSADNGSSFVSSIDQMSHRDRQDDVDSNAANINSFVDSFDDSGSSVKGRISIKKQLAPENYHVYNVTGSVTSASTYSKVACTHVVSAGTISDGDAVHLSFSRTGDKGDTGSTGADGDVSEATAVALAIALG